MSVAALSVQREMSVDCQELPNIILFQMFAWHLGTLQMVWLCCYGCVYDLLSHNQYLIVQHCFSCHGLKELIHVSYVFIIW